MKTSNPIIDTLVESQTQFVNNWMESAKKMQNAFASGSIATEGQSLYKEYFDKQMNILNNMQQSSAGMFSQSSNPQEFFKNWFNQQAAYAKQMADFNQSINNSFANFGRPAQDYMAGFGQSNTVFTNLYNTWLNTINSTYDNLSRNFGNGFNKDVFGSFMQGNQVFARMQEFFQPMAEAMQKGQFNYEAFKERFTPEHYTNLTKQMFAGFYNDAPVKEVYDNAIKQIQSFFSGQQNLSKEYFNLMQNAGKDFPQMFGNNAVANGMREFYGQINNIFGKTFEPLLKLVNAGKEKENIEATIALMDRVAEYTVKQAELQAYLQNAAKKSIEKVAEQYAAKFKDSKDLTQVPTANELYSEWVKINEQLFTDLFASEEFSKVKGEAMNLSLDVKKHFEKQFEQAFSNLPVVFKSEVEELEKTIYDLRKQVKELQAKLSIQSAAEQTEEEKKSRKK